MAQQIDALQKRIADLERREKPRLNRGTANPSGWPTGLPFWRSDLGMWIYFDGTRWLTQELYATTVVETKLGFSGQSALVPIRADYAIYMVKVVTRARVASPNNASNYWRIFLQCYNVDRSAHTDPSVPDTAALGTATWADLNASLLTTMPTNYGWFSIQTLTVGSPGALDVGCAVYYRYVIT